MLISCFEEDILANLSCRLDVAFGRLLPQELRMLVEEAPRRKVYKLSRYSFCVVQACNSITTTNPKELADEDGIGLL